MRSESADTITLTLLNFILGISSILLLLFSTISPYPFISVAGYLLAFFVILSAALKIIVQYIHRIHRPLIRQLSLVITVGFSLFLTFFIIGCLWIGLEVKALCLSATQQYGGNCVQSLINTLNDDSVNLHTRNDAIWALGQLGDNRALPVLQKYYTGIIPDREPLAQTISQYELKKAVNLTSGGTNITAIFWRHGIK